LQLIFYLIAFSLIGTIGFLGGKIRKYPPDAFFLKAEFTATLYLCILVVVFQSVALSVGKGVQVARLVGSTLYCTVGHVIIFCSTVWPYFLSRKEEALMLQASISRLPAFRTILLSPEVYGLFMSYLEHEFSSENLLFVREVAEFRKLPAENTPIIRDQAKDIFVKFCKEGAPFQVNLPHSMLQRIKQEIQKLDIEDGATSPALLVSVPSSDSQCESTLLISPTQIFDKAQAEIYELMKTDSFPRFERTPQFAAIRPTLNISEHNRSISKSSIRLSARHSLDRKDHVSFSVAEQLVDGAIQLHEIETSVA